MTSRTDITEEEFGSLESDPSVVVVNYKDSPDDVAEAFAEALASVGIEVECLVPPEGIPSLLYKVKIKHSST